VFIVLSGIGLRLATHGENHRNRYGPIQDTDTVTMDRLYIGSYRSYQTASFPTTSRDLQDYFIHREPSECNFEYNWLHHTWPCCRYTRSTPCLKKRPTFGLL